eukprot:Skav225343  [mRNA]  locus=scaffold3721:40003:41504:+ [translate_table: standard]
MEDGLIGMLDVLLEQKDRFDYVLVEADLLVILFAFLPFLVKIYHAGNWDSRSRSCLRGKAEEDSKTSLGLEAEALKQVACADVLILNKVDLVSEAMAWHSSATLREINPTARRAALLSAGALLWILSFVRLLESRFAEVPLGDILGLQAFDKDRLGPERMPRMRKSQ